MRMTPMGRLGAALFFLCGAVLPALAGESINPVFSPSAEASRVACDGTGTAPVRKVPCVLRSAYVTTGATAGYLLIFNLASAPSNGAVTPRECIVAPANQTTGIIYSDGTQEPYATGLTVEFSTTGCFTATSSATAFFKIRAQ